MICIFPNVASQLSMSLTKLEVWTQFSKDSSCLCHEYGEAGYFENVPPIGFEKMNGSNDRYITEVFHHSNCSEGGTEYCVKCFCQKCSEARKENAMCRCSFSSASGDSHESLDCNANYKSCKRGVLCSQSSENELSGSSNESLNDCQTCEGYLCTCNLYTKSILIFEDAQNSQSLYTCKKHLLEFTVFCENCDAPICDVCLKNEIHDTHVHVPLKNVITRKRGEAISLKNNILKMKTFFDNSAESITELKHSIQKKNDEVCMKISDSFCHLQKLIKNRETTLINKVKKISSVKQGLLDKQLEQLMKVCDDIEESTSVCLDECNIFDAYENLESTLIQMREETELCSLHEDDYIDFNPPNDQTYATIETAGILHCSAHPSECFATGQGTRWAVRNRQAFFQIHCKDHSSEIRTSGGDALIVVINAPDGSGVRTDLRDNFNGTYYVSYVPQIVGFHTIHIMIRGTHIVDSPFTVEVRGSRVYENIVEAQKQISREGEKPGQLCRPWGVACDSNDNIYVADRSNNRIQVFNSEGEFSFMFGTSGKSTGQFDRPAGIEVCNQTKRIIVADKDNHRIQIFTLKGAFVLTFGEKGNQIGQFNYPWDVAVSNECYILVSDTRNHRVQLFDYEGNFISKYGFEGNQWKLFDSPRGVCFQSDGEIIVTDFNNHRLVIIQPDFQTARVVGNEGNGNGQFVRPQGLATDQEGNIVVSDSRNNRIQILLRSGDYRYKFGPHIGKCGQLDRPSGVCVNNKGQIIIVDFGHNRLLVF